MKDIHLMYLASLYICFDLDPSIHQTDKDRLLLSLKEKLKQKFRNKLTLKIDDQENSLALAFFEHSYEKVPFYFNEILEVPDIINNNHVFRDNLLTPINKIALT